MIQISFDDKVKIGLQYALETLHGCSPFGLEKIRRLHFYTSAEREELETELYNVEKAARFQSELKGEYDKIMVLLCQMKEVRGSLNRCAAGEVLDHVELFEIKNYLQRIESLLPLYDKINEKIEFKDLKLHDVASALEVLDPEGSRSRGFYIPDGATEKLKEIRQEKKRIEESIYKAQTDAERDFLKQKRTVICSEEESEEMKVRKSICLKLIPIVPDLLDNTEMIGRLDFIIQKANFAARYGGTRPVVTEDTLEMTNMINPELVDLLSEKGREFVPVSIALSNGATVITGANMGGKSVVMKTLVLNVLLHQAGFLVCAEKASMPIFDNVKMLFDDLQSIQSGLSGFGSEIVHFQEALETVEKEYSLFLLDEFARGTNPDEGAVIVQAVTKYLNKIRGMSLLTTHYDRVAEHAVCHYQIIGLRDVDPVKIRQEMKATNEDGVTVIARHMNYGLYKVEGKSDCPRDALNICRMLSLNQEILNSIESSY